MKTNRKLCAAAFGLLGLASGCIVGSPEPWLNEASRDPDAGLTGAWAETRGNREAAVLWFAPRPGAEGTWTLRADRLREQWTYEVTAHRVDGVALLQVAPAESAGSASPFALMPAHLLLRMDRDADGTLSLRAMNVAAARKRLADDPLRALDTRTDKKDGYILIGEPTEKLAAWVARHVKDPDLFERDPIYVLKPIREDLNKKSEK